MSNATFARPALLAPAAAHTHVVHDHVRSLGRHLRHCREAQGRFFGLNRLATDLHGWVAPRFVTTLSVAAVLIALACN